jgi:hypothetical protein
MNDIKTSELTGAALDWAVAKCEGGKNTVDTWWIHIYGKDWTLRKKCQRSWSPSTDWAQGGPIIDRVRISIDAPYDTAGWVASTQESIGYEGDTPLIAAMRCYVASQLGDQVEIPEELNHD